jgi:tetratricopeptide (TPR) repeat protein
MKLVTLKSLMFKSNKFQLSLAIFLIAFSAQAQEFEKKFKELAGRNDTAAQSRLLKDWEVAEPKNPELYIAYFNFYASKSMEDVIALEEKPKVEALQLNDTGTGKPVGYLNFSTRYRSDILQKGFDYIDKGLALHPNRLDMRFGKIYMLGEAENFEMFTKVLIETIDYGNSIKDAWLWKEGKPLEDAKQFFLGSMQDYIATLYNTENDDLLPNMRQISETILKYNPDHVVSLANVALTYIIKEDYDKALTYLLKAEKFDPKDIIVLNNIAEVYVRKKDKSNAKIYYEKIIKDGSKEEADDAREKLKKLN